MAQQVREVQPEGATAIAGPTSIERQTMQKKLAIVGGPS